MKNTFFDQHTTDNDNNLAQLFFGYIHYCHESIWLLKQHVFGKLCTSLNYLTEDQLKEAISTQKRAFDSGKQIHIGEILLQTYLLDIEQVYSLCQILGEELVRDKNNELYKTFFSTEEERILHGKNLQQKKIHEITNEELLRFLRIDYWSPRPIPKNTKESHDLFVFLNMETHSKMKVSELDEEFHNVLATFEHWSTTSILVDEKYLNHLKETEVAKERAKSLELIKQVFLGYRKNLRELLWLLQQKMFEELSIKYYKITSEQVENASKVQHRAFQKNKQLQLSEIMLHMYLLDEKQVYDILKGIGNRIMYDEKEKYYLVSSPNVSPEAVNANSLKEMEGKYEILMQSMRIDLAKPMLMPKELVPHSSFLFYRKRIDYKPSFSIASKESNAAIHSFYKYLKLEAPRHIQKNGTENVAFNETHKAPEIIMDQDNRNQTMSAILLSEESAVEMEALTGNVSLKKRLRQTMSLSALPVSESDKQEIFGTKKTTEILNKFSKTITMSLQKRARARKTKEKKAAPSTRKPNNYERYSETVYGYVMANIDAQEKGLPTQKEIMGKRTNMFEQIARRIDRPQEIKEIKVKKDIPNLYDEILAEIETDQSEGNNKFAVKRADDVTKEDVPKKELVAKEVATDPEYDFSEYYIDFKSGEQMPDYLEGVAVDSKIIDLEEDLMDISTEVDSFLQSFDSIDENTDIEKLYDKYGVDVGKNFDPLLEIKEERKDDNVDVTKKSPIKNPVLAKTISISQPKLHNAIPTALEYMEGYSPQKSSKMPKLILAIFLLLFTSGLLYLFIQPYLNDPKNDDVIVIKENKKVKQVEVVKNTVDKNDFQKIVTETTKDPKNRKKPRKKIKKTKKRQKNKVVNKNKINDLRKKLYGKEQNVKKVANALRSFSQTGRLSENDVPFIKELYNQHVANKKIRGLCIWTMGSIQSDDGRRWLEEILVTSQENTDRKSALNALEKIGDSAAKDTILETFQREQDTTVIEAAAYSLTKISPNNEQIQQTMIAKFYELTDETIKRKILNAIASMQIESQGALFVRIAVDAQYSTSIRLEALDALMLNSAGNSSEYVSEISILSASEDEELKEKAEEALEFLSNP